MVLSRTFEPPDLLVANLTGLVTARDQASLVEWVRDMLRVVGEVRLLVRLHRFEGWRPESAFSDVALWLRDDEAVTRMAIVGQSAWRRQLLTFVVEPVRQIPVAYFETEGEARQWLAGPSLRDGGWH